MPQPFKCPSCGGPLEYDGHAITVRCPFCTNSVIVPEELRSDAAFAPPAAIPLQDQLGRLAELGRLIRSGRKIEAIKLYRETFGCGLKEAKDAIESLEAGRPIAVSHSSIGMNGNTVIDPARVPNWPTAPVPPLPSQTRKSHKLLAVVFLLFVIVLAVGIGLVINNVNSKKSASAGGTETSRAGGSSDSGRGSTTAARAGSATVLLEFGSEGIGAGQFKDARTIAVDGQGRIYVGEYTGGRVQVFDSAGAFLTQWSVDPKMPLLQLAADRQGTVYVVQSGGITRYDGMTGRELGRMQRIGGSGFISDMTLTLDGGMAVVQQGEDLLKLDSSGQVTRAIKSAISEQSGDSELSTRIAVDGLGNIYALGRFNDAVFKFGPNGKYITRFGGKGDQPGQFRAPYSIAVDGQGRVYVGDFNGIAVFDTNGRYLETLKLEHNIAFGMVFNDKNELFIAARASVYKLAVKEH